MLAMLRLVTIDPGVVGMRRTIMMWAMREKKQMLIHATQC